MVINSRRQSMKAMIDHFGLLAPLYDRLIKPPDPEGLVDILGLPAQGVLLDAGGGTGRVAQLLQRHVDSVVVGDESWEMLQQAREKGLQQTVICAAEQLPYRDATFSRVLVVDALHHFADQQRAIGELVRVLARGGRLVIQEPDLKRLTVKLVALGEKLALMRSRFYYPEEIRQMVASFGVPSRIERDDQFAAWIVAEKS